MLIGAFSLAMNRTLEVGQGSRGVALEHVTDRLRGETPPPGRHRPVCWCGGREVGSEVLIEDEEVFCPRVAGMDISKTDAKGCGGLVGQGGVKQGKVRTFPTTTPGLPRLRDWLEELDIALVAMESTGVYWKPLFLVLEERFTCWLLNPRDVKKVPGRKSDVTDAQWI